MKFKSFNTNTDPFTDLLFNILLGFDFLFFITILFINPITKLGNINMKAEFIITIDWPANLPDDVDVWVKDPKFVTKNFSEDQIVKYLCFLILNDAVDVALWVLNKTYKKFK